MNKRVVTEYRFNHLECGVRSFIGPVTRFQDDHGNDYREVFTKHLPSNGPWQLAEEIECVMCDAVIHPDERGCIKCLGETNE